MNKEILESPFHESKFRVYYEDTDSQGIVYFASYFRFFERGRTDFIRDLGLSHKILREDAGVIFVVKKCEAEYHATAKLEDVLIIKTKVSHLRNTSFEMVQEIYRESDNQLITTGKSVVVTVDKDIKPQRLPEDMRKILLS